MDTPNIYTTARTAPAALRSKVKRKQSTRALT